MNIILQAIKSLFRKVESRFNADMDSVRRDFVRVSHLVGGKMNAVDPSGGGSFSMNRKAETPIGENSHAEGNNTTASGSHSHAEGNRTTASGIQSHAEGCFTTASGYASHAEGMDTIAGCDYQHVHGAYNIADPYANLNYRDGRGKYIHIVGNGEDPIIGDPRRSNAHTLDWSGLGWFAGGLKVGGTGQDDEASRTVMVNGDTQIVLTSPGGKKFAITVSDDGTLTATAL